MQNVPRHCISRNLQMFCWSFASGGVLRTTHLVFVRKSGSKLMWVSVRAASFSLTPKSGVSLCAVEKRRSLFLRSAHPYRYLSPATLAKLRAVKGVCVLGRLQRSTFYCRSSLFLASSHGFLGSVSIYYHQPGINRTASRKNETRCKKKRRVCVYHRKTRAPFVSVRPLPVDKLHNEKAEGKSRLQRLLNTHTKSAAAAWIYAH